MPIKNVLQASACFCLALFTTTSEAQDLPIYTETQTSISITPRQPVFILKLKSNPTTGYSWSLKNYNKNLIKPVTHYYKHPDTSLMGAGGFEFWTFKALAPAFQKPQELTISMIYIRPWEKKVSGTELVFKVVSKAN